MTKLVFPFTVYNVTGRLLQQQEVAMMVSKDQELFGAFFTMVYKVLVYNDEQLHVNLDPSVREVLKLVSSIDSKSFSLNEISSSTKVAESIKRQFGQHVTAEYLGKFLAFSDLFYKLQTSERNKRDLVPSAVKAIGGLITEQASLLRGGLNPDGTVIEANIETVRILYEMDQAEAVLLEHATMLSIDAEAQIFLKRLEAACTRNGHFKQLFELALIDTYRNDLDGFGSFKDAVAAADRALSHKTSKPLAFNIVKQGNQGDIRPLSQFWGKVITYNHDEGEEGLIKLFIKPINQNKSYSSVIARINEKMIPLFRDVLQDVSGEEGVNVLLYGPRSLDKEQSFMRALEGISYNVFETNISASDAWGDEASVTWAAQRILEKQTAVNGGLNVLLVRDAASVLSRGSKRFSFSSLFAEEALEDKKESELDSDVLLLTKSRTPTIWLTTDPTTLSPEAVGKFMLHLEVIPGTRADRKAEVERIADSLNLPPEVRQALAKYMQLGAVQVETAARVVKLLELQEPKSYETLLQLVEESQKALQREKTEEIRESVTKYDLSLLNIRSKFSPEQVVEALGKKGRGTLCFYGMPGTGKTQLAEYIANKLDKPLLVKRASDLLSKWVGENEQHIAEMFREAKAEGAVLLLDEADSFLRDRALSKNSWEVTMVNELLQQMERFPGIFICASNLFDQLDAAAIRRFTFKFNFLELDEHQRVKMFSNEAGVTPTQGTKLYDDLMMLRHLTPGDFATVKRQADLFDAVLTPEDWIKQLSEEAKAKLAGLSRNFEVDRM